MPKGRMEAFSDGVIAIVITIMVLELKVPHGHALADLRPLWPRFLSYVLSFLYIAIYWNNHHHLLHAARRVDAGVLWANLHLLFWLSLVPFTTGFMGENNLAALPTALYGCVLFAAAGAYWILQWRILCQHGLDSALARAIGRDLKGKLSVVFYLVAVGAAAWSPLFSNAVYVGIALLWIVPDRRIERALAEAAARG